MNINSMDDKNRTKNASRNAFFGVTLKIYQIIMPFVVRTAMIYLMGVQYLGLNSLFTSLLQVLNLAELGVGTAMVYSMYKPIVESDKDTICALLRLYKIYYRVIGFIIAIIGLMISPFIPKLINGTIPQGLNIYILYFLNLSATVLSYWLFAYKNALLQAHQRADISSKVTIVTNTIQYLLQIFVLWIYRDYYLFILVALLTQVITNIITAIIAYKMYPQYKPIGKLKTEETRRINARIRDLFTARLGTVLGTSVDNVVISAFLGLSMIAIYQNYYYIMNSVASIIIVIFTSCTAGIGNSLIAESPEKNYNDFRKLAFLTMWICTVCISCFASMYQPFMILWVGKELMLPDTIVVLMSTYFFLQIVHKLSCIYKDAAGIWHKDRFRPIVYGIVNLILNISTVKTLGIYGIILSTIISYIIIAMPWVIHNLFYYVFKRNPKEYIIEICKGVAVSTISAILCFAICMNIHINGIVGLLCRFIVAVSVSNTIFIFLRKRNKIYNQAVELLNKITKYKLNRVFSLLIYNGGK